MISGYEPPFTYYGFLPEKRKDRDKLLDGAREVSVFYVSVHDIKENMAYLRDRLGDRECCLVKELTKSRERARFCRLSDVIDDDKGEFVLVVNRQTDRNPLCSLSAEEHLNYYVQGGMSKLSRTFLNIFSIGIRGKTEARTR